MQSTEKINGNWGEMVSDWSNWTRKKLGFNVTESIYFLSVWIREKLAKNFLLPIGE